MQVGENEHASQNRIIRLFQEELKYDYLGNWLHRKGNSNIEEELLADYLTNKAQYAPALVSRAMFQLKQATQDFGDDSLFTTNKAVYQLLRYGIKVKATASKPYETVHLIDWHHPENNHFAIAEEVTLVEDKSKRPDVVLYINGIAVGVLELKRSTESLTKGITQTLLNQRKDYIRSFFATIQLCFAGNDSEGLRYATTQTPAKYWLRWKEDVDQQDRLQLDKYLLKLCEKGRLLDLLYNFVLFDAGIKKVPRAHQYFGVKEAQKYVRKYQGGIIWHTQGSGKSITMVLLAKWIKEYDPQARILVVTDRTELDKQIEGVFKDAGEKKVYRARSGKDLLTQLAKPEVRLLTTLVHKFDTRGKRSFAQFIRDLESHPVPVAGQLYVLVDEAHRSQSDKFHRAMKTILPDAVFFGFTGTPLLKKNKKTTQMVFGPYIHRYKFDEGVADGVILDLAYEARDIDQRLSSPIKVEAWFEAKTRGLNTYQKGLLKARWGRMKEVLSSKSRMDKVVADINLDLASRPGLSEDWGNAMLVAHSIYEACQYYRLLRDSGLGKRVGLVTSYNPQSKDITGEEMGDYTDTQKRSIYKLYEELLANVNAEPGKSKSETYEDQVKHLFTQEPGRMKLLVVVAKLLTGFDAPSCTYLYLDKTLKDHGLFQAICRTNRLHGEEKVRGYIIDYRDQFEQVGAAMQVYTSELDDEGATLYDINIQLENRLKVGKARLDATREALTLLCEPVKPPRSKLEYQHYFCGNVEDPEAVKATAIRRMQLYRAVAAFIRAYAQIADDMGTAGYDQHEQEEIAQELIFYKNLRDEIRYAAVEELDLKPYEADMRHLIDTYIVAEESEVISPFKGMTLLQIMSSAGVQAAIGSLPAGIRGNQRSVAETIARNVRSTIIQQYTIDPAHYAKMSQLLDELIRLRRENAIAYGEFLARIAALAKEVTDGNEEAFPATMDTPGKRSLYNNLGENEALVHTLDINLKAECPADWRGHQGKEQAVRKAIYDALVEYYSQASEKGGEVQESLEHDYQINTQVERIFKLIWDHPEY